MDPLEEQLRNLTILNFRALPPKRAAQEKRPVQDDRVTECDSRQSNKSTESPQVSQSKLVTDACEALYSQPLLDHKTKDKIYGTKLLRKHPNYTIQAGEKSSNSKSTLDNPAVLEQQLEALAYHKLQMEKKGLLGTQGELLKPIPKLSSTSLCEMKDHNQPSMYSNFQSLLKKNDGLRSRCTESSTLSEKSSHSSSSYIKEMDAEPKNVTLPIEAMSKCNSYSANTDFFLISKEPCADSPPPPSPVSSSYSELRRATNIFNKSPNSLENASNKLTAIMPTSENLSLHNRNYCVQYKQTSPTVQIHQNKSDIDYYGCSRLSQSSSTYDSIYEPINPPSEMSARSNYNLYVSYVNGSNVPSSSISTSASMLGTINSSGANTPIICDGSYVNEVRPEQKVYQNRHEVENVANYAMAPINESDNYGHCFKCSERVLCENSGCTAMDNIYHISCFTCSECQINLQGKPFYALEGKPYCEYDYLQTLEKCCCCMKPILERILRATGKPYHPQCFICVVCGKSLDGIPFTVDATNQNYCIADFHKKFAPRCCVCKEPIMPEPGQEETVRVVALDRSFHLECYKCEDCGLLLSSEADGRGCYPLDDHVLCKSCNAQRVQALTNRMTSEC